jgi:hypothetical protein
MQLSLLTKVPPVSTTSLQGKGQKVVFYSAELPQPSNKGITVQIDGYGG